MKKKIIEISTKIVLVHMFLLGTFTSPVKAETTPNISASSIKAETGSTVQLIVNLNSNPGIWSLVFDIVYDNTALVFKSCTNGNVFAKDEVTTPPIESAGIYRFLASKNGVTNTNVTGTLCILTFTVKDNIPLKNYPVSIMVSEDNTINEKKEEVPLITANGNIISVNCIHKNSTWVTTTLATNNKRGEQKLICNKCHVILATRTLDFNNNNNNNNITSNEAVNNENIIPNIPTVLASEQEMVLVNASKTVYKITEGNGSQWKSTDKKGISFSSDGNVVNFTGIKIDGVLIDKKNYICEIDSTSITLNESYLNTLKAGNHKLTFVFKDGEVSADFIVVAANSDMKIVQHTNESTIIYEVIAIIVVLAGVCSIGTFVYLKKRTNNVI